MPCKKGKWRRCDASLFVLRTQMDDVKTPPYVVSLTLSKPFSVLMAGRNSVALHLIFNEVMTTESGCNFSEAEKWINQRHSLHRKV